MRKKTHEEYVTELAIKNPNVVAAEVYINANTKILHRCLIHDVFWNTTPNNALMGAGCPECHGARIGASLKKSHEQYVAEVATVNPDIVVVVEDYIDSVTPILHRCKIDGFEWNVSPTSILSGTGCPQCQESQGERRVRQWLQKYSIEYIYQKPFPGCKDKQELPFDFYIEQYNICIEYDGEHHFMPVNFGSDIEKAIKRFITIKYHDQIKTKYCNDNNIHLLRIPYYKNVEEELEKFFIHLI